MLISNNILDSRIQKISKVKMTKTLKQIQSVSILKYPSSNKPSILSYKTISYDEVLCLGQLQLLLAKELSHSAELQCLYCCKKKICGNSASLQVTNSITIYTIQLRALMRIRYRKLIDHINRTI